MVTVKGKNKQYQATTSFNLSVTQPTIAVNTPTITPNGGTFTDSTTVTLQTSTAGASIYYTTDGTNPTQSSKQYTAPFTLTATSLVKAEAFKSSMTPSSLASAWFTKSVSSFDFSLSNSGNKSVTAGSSVTNTISAALVSGSTQTVTYSVAGLPSGSTASFSAASCSPTCSSTLTISTSGSTPAGTSAIAVAATSGGLTRTTSFNLTVNLPTVATPDDQSQWWQLYRFRFSDSAERHLGCVDLLHHRRLNTDSILESLCWSLHSYEQRGGQSDRVQERL